MTNSFEKQIKEVHYAAGSETAYVLNLRLYRSQGTDHSTTDGTGLKTWHIYLRNKWANDWNDLRITDGSNTALPFYFEPVLSNEVQYVDVGVKLTDASCAGSIRIHYNDSSLTTTTGNKNNTYIEYDGFLGTAPDPDMWHSSYRSYYTSVSNGILTQASTFAGFILSYVTSQPTKARYKARGRCPNGVTSGSFYAKLDNHGITITSGGTSWMEFEVLLDGTNAKMYLDGVLQGTEDLGLSYEYDDWTLGKSDVCPYVEWDYASVQPWAETPPDILSSRYLIVGIIPISAIDDASIEIIEISGTGSVSVITMISSTASVDDWAEILGPDTGVGVASGVDNWAEVLYPGLSIGASSGIDNWAEMIGPGTGFGILSAVDDWAEIIGPQSAIESSFSVDNWAEILGPTTGFGALSDVDNWAEILGPQTALSTIFGVDDWAEILGPVTGLGTLSEIDGWSDVLEDSVVTSPYIEIQGEMSVGIVSDVATFPELGGGAGVGIGGTMISVESGVDDWAEIIGPQTGIGTEIPVSGEGSAEETTNPWEIPITISGTAGLQSGVAIATETSIDNWAQILGTIIGFGAELGVDDWAEILGPITGFSILSAVDNWGSVEAWADEEEEILPQGVATLEVTTVIGTQSGVDDWAQVLYPATGFGISSEIDNWGQALWAWGDFSVSTEIDGSGDPGVDEPETDPEATGVGSFEVSTVTTHAGIEIAGTGALVVTSPGYVNEYSIPKNLYARWSSYTEVITTKVDIDNHIQTVVIHRSNGTDYIDDSSFPVLHLYVGNNCRPDYGDIRFTNSLGEELDYYLDSSYDSDSAKIILDFGEADHATSIKVWYGNPSAVTTSQGSAIEFPENLATTFEEDFETADDAWTFTGSASRSTSYKETGSYGVGNPAAATGTVSRTITLTGNDKLYYSIYRNSGEWGDSYVRVKCGTSSVDFYPPVGYWTQRERNLAYKDPGDYVLSFEAWYDGSDNTTLMKVDNIWIVGNVPLAEDLPELISSAASKNPNYAGWIPTPVKIWQKILNIKAVGLLDMVGIADSYITGTAGVSVKTTTVIKPVEALGEASGTSSPIRMSVASEASGEASVSQSEVQGMPFAEFSGTGLVYAAPAVIGFDISRYDFESLTVSRSIQDPMWSCSGTIIGSDIPKAYDAFSINVPDHLGVNHRIFFGFIPGNDAIQSVASDATDIQAYSAPFYLSRQYLPDGNTSYPEAWSWTPRKMLIRWLGGESDKWRKITGIYPYKIFDPTSHGNAYTPKDYVFQPKTSKSGAIKEVCEYAQMLFDVKWKELGGETVPHAYLVHEDDIDDAYWGLDLPDLVAFSYPDPYIKDVITATEKVDEKYNRITVRSSAPDGTQYAFTKETDDLIAGDELPVEYLESVSDLPQDADHGAWVEERANLLFEYYSAHAYTYTMTLIDRTDLELYQRLIFTGFDVIPSTTMRITAIEYTLHATHTDVTITVAPVSKLSSLKRLQAASTADSTSEIQSIVTNEVDSIPTGVIGTVIAVGDYEATVELDGQEGSEVKGKIV